MLIKATPIEAKTGIKIAINPKEIACITEHNSSSKIYFTYNASLYSVEVKEKYSDLVSLWEKNL